MNGAATQVVGATDQDKEALYLGSAQDLLLASIGPVPLRYTGVLDERAMKAIKSLSDQYNLFPLLYCQWRKQLDHFDSSETVRDLLEALRPEYLNHVVHSMKQEAVEKELACLLDAEGFDNVIIKGSQIAREIYGDPNCRTSVDIDILVRKQDVIGVDALLVASEYLSDQMLPMRYCIHRLHHAVYRRPNTNILIEIHWYFNRPFLFNLSSEAIWEQIRKTDSGRFKLDQEMILIMLLIHHHTHAFRILKTLVDILWCLYKFGSDMQWDSFAVKLKSIGLVKTAQISLGQIQLLWKDSVKGVKEVQDFGRALDKVISRQPRFMIRHFNLNLDTNYGCETYKDKFLARFALDRFSTIMLAAFRTVFPAPAEIKEFYRDRRISALPINYAKFMSWRIGEWTGLWGKPTT